jgi:hypothetical protein
VPRIRFAPGPLPEHVAASAAPRVLVPTAGDERAAAEIVAGIADEKLRESVQKALSFSLARRAVGDPV